MSFSYGDGAFASHAPSLFFLIAFILYHYSLQYVFTLLNQKKSNGKKYYRSKLNKIIMLIITADITSIFS